ncbi:DNA cytosine methyltransferase [Pseudoalteromonas piscicida]|uniref:DNA cytosine methyltransferase n=1 Tax=Pseudoalteromonas piscicida TaxID=43662 RepID=UPI001C96A8B5|nr:DNA cytosine methyltransferase [Pseudoalteromonas piscicida]QZO12608.1 DNA cytosine methyltransferase [Pseudoalteromonas piscicida]
MKNKLILSTFPGIDLFGRGFEQQGACVVQAQDKILGGDICRFHPPKGRFDGVIGGSPCQDFSRLNRNPSNNSMRLLNEFQRVVGEAEPDWFLHENVVGVPEFEIHGYQTQRFHLDLAWFSDFSRLRVFTFGSKSGVRLNPVTGSNRNTKGTAIVGGDERSFESCCEIQGLREPLNLEFLTLTAKKQVVANAVPLQLSYYVAALINESVYQAPTPEIEMQSLRACACGCGRAVTGRAKTASAACRKRLSRKAKCDEPALDSVTARAGVL